MGFSYILVREKSLIYKGEIYEYMSFLEDNKISKKRILIILDESLYINKVDIRSEKMTIEDIVSKIIKESFGNEKEILFHYEVTENKETLYIYGVRGGMKIAKLCKDASEIKVFPLQIWVVNILKYRIKEKSWRCIFRYMNEYYFCSIINGVLELAFVQNNIDSINNRFKEFLSEDALYLDSKIDGTDISGVENYKYIELGEVLNEKIFCQ